MRVHRPTSQTQVRRLDEEPVQTASTLLHTSTTPRTAPSRERRGPPKASKTASRQSTRHLPPPQLQLLSQNVQGLLKNREHLDNWFDAFRRKYDRRQFDVVILQEARATAKWAPVLEDMYARAWGYDRRKLPQPLSFWPATESAAGGVAILLHPQSGLTDVRPWRQDLWSAHFAAVQGRLDGDLVTVVCVYGNIHHATRDQHFRLLAQLPKPDDVVLLGGDFNCVLDTELDRSHRPSSQHSTEGLSGLLTAWNLIDAATDDVLAAASTQDVLEFHAVHHTFMYTLRDARLATARLDRWYLSATYYQRLRRLKATAPFGRADHEEVILQLAAAESDSQRKQKPTPRLRYPLPDCARTAARAACEAILEMAGSTLVGLPADQSAPQWDIVKTDIRRESLLVQREQLMLATRRYRQQTKRLVTALREAKRNVNSRVHTAAASVEMITSAMANLCLDPAARFRSLRQDLMWWSGPIQTGRGTSSCGGWADPDRRVAPKAFGAR